MVRDSTRIPASRTSSSGPRRSYGSPRATLPVFAGSCAGCPRCPPWIRRDGRMSGTWRGIHWLSPPLLTSSGTGPPHRLIRRRPACGQWRGPLRCECPLIGSVPVPTAPWPPGGCCWRSGTACGRIAATSRRSRTASPTSWDGTRSERVSSPGSGTALRGIRTSASRWRTGSTPRLPDSWSAVPTKSVATIACAAPTGCGTSIPSRHEPGPTSTGPSRPTRWPSTGTRPWQFSWVT